ncbi:MAG TPA: PQQ-binding-like beta-propeller repeat protein [Verrucomicrobiae bacterium]|nr:PQQ-binding-like beta-propeller repeat protein [Verrucomicrobiae bacterium]
MTNDGITNLWSYNLPDGYADASPAVAADGTIYETTFSGKLLAISSQGKLKWIFQAGRETKSSPAIADDGTIYFGSRDRKLYAVTPQGKLKWTFATGAWVDSSPAIAAEGTIYFGSWDKYFYALNPDGSKKWEFTTKGIVDSSPAIDAGGNIYFGSHDKNFYALNPNGSLRWKFSTGGAIISSPAIGGKGEIYLTSLDGNFYALKPDGGESWRLHLGGVTESSPVLDENENLYLAVNQQNASVTADGKKRWAAASDASIDASPAVAVGGTVYCSAPWHDLVGIKSDGREIWRLKTDTDPNHGNIVGSLTIGTNGTIYFANTAYVIAVNSTNQLAPPAKSSWPMFHANPRHTGRVNEINKSP